MHKGETRFAMGESEIHPAVVIKIQHSNANGNITLRSKPLAPRLLELSLSRTLEEHWRTKDASGHHQINGAVIVQISANRVYPRDIEPSLAANIRESAVSVVSPHATVALQKGDRDWSRSWFRKLVRWAAHLCHEKIQITVMVVVNKS